MALMIEEGRATMPDADAELMLRFQAGEVDAFETLFVRHSPSVVRFAFRFVHDREVAEELAQETFLRVHDAGPAYRPEAKFTTWLYRIATNVCLNEIRRPRYKLAHQSLDSTPAGNPDAFPLEIEDPHTAGADVRLERDALGRVIRKALSRLPEKQRLAFILTKYQDLSYAEAASVMHTSEKAVKSLMHRAKQALAACLKDLLPDIVK